MAKKTGGARSFLEDNCNVNKGFTQKCTPTFGWNGQKRLAEPDLFRKQQQYKIKRNEARTFMTMQRYVALVRGINVGRAKRVAMADLRKLVSDLGYTDVRSLLNSGNIVFSAAQLAPAKAAAAIENALVLKLGVAARVMVLSSTELAAIVSDNSLLALADDHARLMVFVIADPSLREHVAVLCQRDGDGGGAGVMALGRHAAYVWCPTGVLDSAPAAEIGKLLGDATTARNWHTVTKLHRLCAENA
jgi:uncharacterized protein (DUF1697 family)